VHHIPVLGHPTNSASVPQQGIGTMPRFSILQPAISKARPRSCTCSLRFGRFWHGAGNLAAPGAWVLQGQHLCGDETSFSPGGFKLACLAAGGALEALKAIMVGRVKTSYVLCRPPGEGRDAGAKCARAAQQRVLLCLHRCIMCT